MTLVARPSREGSRADLALRRQQVPRCPLRRFRISSASSTRTTRSPSPPSSIVNSSRARSRRPRSIRPFGVLLSRITGSGAACRSVLPLSSLSFLLEPLGCTPSEPDWTRPLVLGSRSYSAAAATCCSPWSAFAYSETPFGMRLNDGGVEARWRCRTVARVGLPMYDARVSDTWPWGRDAPSQSVVRTAPLLLRWPCRASVHL